MNETRLRHLAPERPASGYWVEVTAFHAQTGKALEGFQLGGYSAETPARAVARLRLRVRRAAWHMAQVAARRATFEWLSDRWAMEQALASLAHGAMYLHLVDEGETCYEFSARPVYLPASAHVMAARGDANTAVMPLSRRQSA